LKYQFQSLFAKTLFGHISFCNNLLEQVMSQKLPNFEVKPIRRIIRMAQLRAKYPLSESHIYSLIKQGKFPKPFPLVPGGRAVGWYEDVIDDYFAACSNDLTEVI
jgi:prophage regulatory protein